MPTAEEWRRMEHAIFGIAGSDKDIGLVRRYDRLETMLSSFWKVVVIFGSVGVALCTAILALLSYLAANRQHSQIVAAPNPTVAEQHYDASR